MLYFRLQWLSLSLSLVKVLYLHYCWWYDSVDGMTLLASLSLSVSPSLAFRLLAKLIALMHWSGSVRCWVWDTGTNLRGIHFQLSERQLYRADGPRNISRSAGSVHTSEHTHPCLLDSSELCRDSGLNGENMLTVYVAYKSMIRQNAQLILGSTHARTHAH